MNASGVECGAAAGAAGVVAHWGWCAVAGADSTGGPPSNVVAGGACAGTCSPGCGRPCGTCVPGVVAADTRGWPADADDGATGSAGLSTGGGLDSVGLCGSGPLAGTGAGSPRARVPGGPILVVRSVVVAVLAAAALLGAQGAVSSAQAAP